MPPLRKSDELRKRDDGPLYITQEGLERLHERLVRLEKALPEFIAVTRAAAALGDRSDSAEYTDAKSTLRRTHRQILSTKDQIKRAVIITPPDPATSGSGVVRLGSTVVLEISGAERTFQILGPHETDPTQGRISDQSPLGGALVGHVAGDTVTIETGGGPQKYQILKVS